MKNKIKKTKGIKAWLVTWEWINDVNAVADKVVAILNPRWPMSRVASIVEIIYAMCSYTIEEMITITRHTDSNPYKSTNERGIINCGHNPWLEARKVGNLLVEIDEKTGLEIIKWNELPLYTRIKDKIELVRGPLPKQFCRRISGQPSSMAIYDRVESSFKLGWGPGEVPKRNDL